MTDADSAHLERRSKAPCLYPLDDGRRCLECATCQPTPTNYWAALAEISDLFDGGGWEDADADELRADVEHVIGIVSGVLSRAEIEAAQEANDAG